jgi:C-terminal processing protease CtpA/Prc
MKHAIRLLFFLSITVASATYGQKMVKLQLDDKTDFMLQEIGAVLHQDKDGITVSHAFNGNIKAAENKDAELKEGDALIMMNGVRPKSIKDFRKMYDEVAKGGEFKLGIKRDGNPVIVTVHKVEAKADPHMKMMTMTMDTDDMKLLPGIGTIDDEGKSLKLKEMPPNPDVAKASPLKIGDTFKSMNGKDVTSFKQFKTLYATVKPGESVELKIERDGKEQTLKVKKPEGGQQVIIKRGKP